MDKKEVNICNTCGVKFQWENINNKWTVMPLDGSDHSNCKPKVKIYTKEEIAQYLKDKESK